MSKTLLKWSPVILFIAVTNVAWCALDDDETDPDQQSLRGLRGVHVLVELLNPDVERDGLGREQIRTDAELRMRKAGIKVVTKEQMRSEPGRPYLYIQVSCMKPRNREFYAYCIKVALKQRVLLDRDLNMKCYAITWNESETGAVGMDKVQQIRDGVNDVVDKFINSYLAENANQLKQR